MTSPSPSGGSPDLDSGVAASSVSKGAASSVSEEAASSVSEEAASPVADAAARELAGAIYGERFDQICRYVDILATRGIEWGLIGPREVGRLWERHILNSVAPAGLIAQGSRVIDVGSGAGLPGIPLAVLRPDLELVLLEPLLRRFNFLVEAVSDLGLGDRVHVWRGRAEDHDEVFDVVTCRAVAPLDKLLGWCTPLFYPDGKLLALKGDSAADEVSDAGKFLTKAGLQAEVVSVRAHPDALPTNVIRVHRA